MAETAVSARLVRRVFRHIVLQGAVGGALVVVYARMTAPANPELPRLQNELTTLALYVAILVVVVPVAGYRSQRLFAPDLVFLDEARSPTSAERAALLSLPWRTVTWAARYWVVVAAITALASTPGPEPYRSAFLNALSVVYIAVVLSGLAYLVVERELRPVLAEALGGEAPPDGRWIGPRVRLGVAWVLGAGLPLVAIALTPIIRAPTAPFDLWVPIVFTAVSAVIVSAGLHREATRSVVEPLASVREALARVERGDLDVAIAVDDGGELGQLEAGVNRMVEGLRERVRIQELFGRQVGEAVAARAVAGGTPLGGEVLDVSALFVDIVGSTGLAQRVDPIEVVGLLNRFFAIVVDATAAEDGLVNKFAGDGALCIFGAPEAQSDHRARALRAARSMSSELAVLAVAHPELRAGIGVSSGEVVAGNVGDARRYEYTVIGAPVNEAARLTEAAKSDPGCVLASAATVAGAGQEDGCWEPAGRIELRGIATHVEVWRPRAGS